MTDIFISYATEDREVAQALATEFSKTAWTVFWDRQIGAGAQWNDAIQAMLKSARCVVVLWSKAAADALWVRGEAAVAHGRQVYLPFRIDEHDLPVLFQQTQAVSLEQWVRTRNATDLQPLFDSVASRIGTLQMHGNLEAVEDSEEVSEKHLHLVHSCWRVARQTPFGLMPYQIHVVLFGHPSALDRVDRVAYKLPGYPNGHAHAIKNEREKLFELKQLANGFSIVQADVFMKRPQRVLRLSRFINMSESGPRLLDDFIGRSPFLSSLSDKLVGLPSAVERAIELLRTYSTDAARDRLCAEGIPLLMAETAVQQAVGLRRS